MRLPERLKMQALRPLRRDTAGGIMIIAVFMSVFLVGALWYALGIGDAIVYREYLQDGADATAFTAAVYQARGMNVIALLNLISAAILMVLVAFKAAQLALIATNIASCLAGFIFNPVCDVSTFAEEPMAAAVDRVEGVVKPILRVLAVTRIAAAAAIPELAEARAIAMANRYAPTVHRGIMAAPSLVPGAVERTARIGLPVEQDDRSVLCEHAGETLGDFIFLPLEILPGSSRLGKGVAKYAGHLIGELVTTFPGYFCSALGGSSAPSTERAASPMSKAKALEVCQSRQKVVDEANQHLKAGEAPHVFDSEKCAASLGNALGHSSRSRNLGDKVSSQRIYQPATAGDDYFAAWAFVWGDLKRQSNAPRGVRIAAWNRGGVADPAPFTEYQFSKSEFYYEPKPGDPRTWQANGGIRDDAMWNLRWRARLRRAYPPSRAAGALMTAMVESLDWDPKEGVSAVDIVALLQQPHASLAAEMRETFGDGDPIIH